MKHIYAGTFIKKNDLKSMGVNYPVKLEYYKTVQNTEQINNNEIVYGIEVVKTSYINENVEVENTQISEFTKDEMIVNTILDTLRENEVTPVCAEYIVEDLLKEMVV